MQLSDLIAKWRDPSFGFRHFASLNQRRRFTRGVLLLAGVALFTPTYLRALEVSPTYRIFVLKPGEKVREKLTLTSTEDFAMSVSVEAKDWTKPGVNKNVKTADWLIPDQEPFELKPGESKEINYTVRAPKKLSGEAMGMLSFPTKNLAGAMVSLRLSVAMYVVIEGTEKKSAEVEAISVILSSNTDVSYLIKNTGNVHLRPKGLIMVYDDKEQLVMNVVYDQSLPVMPGQQQAFTASVKNYQLPEGKYLAHINLEDADWNYTYPAQKRKFSVNKEGRVKGQ